MVTFFNFVHEAGWGIFPVLFFGSASLAVALSYARAPRREALAVIVALGVLTCLMGCLGTVTGLQASALHIGDVGIDNKWIFLVGMREALNNMVAALMIVSLDALVVSVSLARRLFASSASSVGAI